MESAQITGRLLYKFGIANDKWKAEMQKQ